MLPVFADTTLPSDGAAPNNKVPQPPRHEPHQKPHQAHPIQQALLKRLNTQPAR